MVSSLPAFPPGPRECGFNQGTELVLTFLAAPRGRVLATALVQTGYCEEAFFTAGTSKITSNIQTWHARGVAGLGVPYQGHVLAATILKTAGSTWDLAAYAL
jgi:hypothetical protein